RCIGNLGAHDNLATGANFPFNQVRIARQPARAELWREPQDERASRAAPKPHFPQQYLTRQVVSHILELDSALANVECGPDDLWLSSQLMNRKRGGSMPRQRKIDSKF